MAQEDYIGGSRVDKNFRQDRGGVSGYSGPFEAVVMGTVDPTHSGRIEVWIEAFGDESTRDQPSSWTTARYLSPYYGVTPHGKIDDAAQPEYEAANGQAYGMWANVPDPGVRVLVVFSNGDRDKCYYIGFIPEPQMNQMVPGIGAKEDVFFPPGKEDQQSKLAHAARLPVTEMDKSEASMNASEFGAIPKPVHSIVASQMWKQGIVADPIRGPISSSAQRESPSTVYGISTPGRPIYATGLKDADAKAALDNGEDNTIVGRYGGHTFVMDDGEVDGSNKLIRLRTSGGHQITMTDDGNSIYIVHANGLTWWELGNEGTIDMYAANSINMRSGGEINLHADTNINLNALENVNIHSTKAVNLEADANLNLTGTGSLIAYGGSVGIKSAGSLATDAAGGASFKSGGHTEIKGGTIGLNDGGAESVNAPEPLVQVNFPDATKDSTEGFKLTPAKFKSIVTRAPTHEPWDGHNKGISNVKPFD